MTNRRPIRARSTRPARLAAAGLARAGIGANAISVASLVFAALAAACLVLAPSLGAALYLLAALFVPLRLLANLLDGMVAVEHGRASPTGPLFNELPDRMADMVLIAAAGYGAALAPGAVGAWSVPLGWLAAALALLTAYVRELGRALGFPADFSGPFAKQQRMWAVTAGAALSFLLPDYAGPLLLTVLVVLTAGTALTIYRRTARLAAALEAAPEPAARLGEDGTTPP